MRNPKTVFVIVDMVSGRIYTCLPRRACPISPDVPVGQEALTANPVRILGLVELWARWYIFPLVMFRRSMALLPVSVFNNNLLQGVSGWLLLSLQQYMAAVWLINKQAKP